MYAGGSY